MKAKKPTKFQIINIQIIELFTSMLNEEIETSKHNGNIPQLFKNMRGAQLDLIRCSGLKKDVNLISNPSVFCYMLANAFVKANFKPETKTAKGISDIIYHNIVFTGIHSCPDTIMKNIENLVKNQSQNLVCID